MKKVLFALALMCGMMFASCGCNTKCCGSDCDSTVVDSVCVCDSTCACDSVLVDSVVVAE